MISRLLYVSSFEITKQHFKWTETTPDINTKTSGVPFKHHKDIDLTRFTDFCCKILALLDTTSYQARPDGFAQRNMKASYCKSSAQFSLKILCKVVFMLFFICYTIKLNSSTHSIQEMAKINIG